MKWIVTNWFWVLTGIAFVAMHVFGHGGHGGHGGHAGHSGGARRRRDEEGEPDDTPASEPKPSAGGHQH